MSLPTSSRRNASITQRAAELGASLLGAAYRNPAVVKNILEAGAVTSAALAAPKLYSYATSGKKAQALKMNSVKRDSVTRAPASKGYSSISTPPTMSMKNGHYRISHRELVSGSIAGSTSFTNQIAFTINPGLAASFPWLSPIANQYEQWVGSVKFIYIPIASTSTAGDVIMFCDYNVYDPQPANSPAGEQQAIDHVGCSISSVWTSAQMSANTGAMFPTGAKKYIRSTNVVGDKRLYDGGKFYLFTNNCANTNTIGKLLVEYVFEFTIPQLEPPLSTPSLVSEYYAGSGTQTFTTNVATVFNPVTTGWITSVDGLGLGASSSGQITLPPGAYLVDFAAEFGDNTAEKMTVGVNFSVGGVSQTAFTSGFALNLPVNGFETATLSQTITCSAVAGTVLEVLVTCIGAAGTLTYGTNSGRLTIQQV